MRFILYACIITKLSLNKPLRRKTDEIHFQRNYDVIININILNISNIITHNTFL